MSSGTTSESSPYSSYAATGAPPAAEGGGWVTFAGLLVLFIGVMNVIYGIAAIDNSTFYVSDAKYIFSDLNTYGWVVLVIGVVQVLVGIGIFARVQVARWLGVLFVSLNLIAQLLWISASPLAGLVFIAIDVLILYGLIAHGSKRPAY